MYMGKFFGAGFASVAAVVTGSRVMVLLVCVLLGGFRISQNALGAGYFLCKRKEILLPYSHDSE